MLFMKCHWCSSNNDEVPNLLQQSEAMIEQGNSFYRRKPSKHENLTSSQNPKKKLNSSPTSRTSSTNGSQNLASSEIKNLSPSQIYRLKSSPTSQTSSSSTNGSQNISVPEVKNLSPSQINRVNSSPNLSSSNIKDLSSSQIYRFNSSPTAYGSQNLSSQIYQIKSSPNSFSSEIENLSPSSLGISNIAASPIHEIHVPDSPHQYHFKSPSPASLDQSPTSWPSSSDSSRGTRGHSSFGSTPINSSENLGFSKPYDSDARSQFTDADEVDVDHVPLVYKTRRKWVSNPNPNLTTISSSEGSSSSSFESIVGSESRWSAYPIPSLDHFKNFESFYDAYDTSNSSE